MPHEVRKRTLDGQLEKIEPHSFFTLKPGEMYIRHQAGGPGFGDPFERDPERVRKDVRNEFLSIESAKRDYGVVIDPVTLEVDYEETRALRGKRGERQ